MSAGAPPASPPQGRAPEGNGSHDRTPASSGVGLRFNLHNHTLRSDGAADARALADAAVKAGLTHLGISDHFRSTKLPVERAIALEDVRDYAEELRSIRFAYADRLTVLAGIEVNFSMVQTDFTFLSRLEPQENPFNALDYILFEYVGDADWMGLGLEELLKVRPLFTVPLGLAHNDLQKNFQGVVQPEGLAKVLAQSHVFVELCPTRRNSRKDSKGDYVPYYRQPGDFNRRFFAAAKAAGLLFSIGCDVHADLREVGEVDDAADFLASAGLAGQGVAAHFWGGRP